MWENQIDPKRKRLEMFTSFAALLRSCGVNESEIFRICSHPGMREEAAPFQRFRRAFKMFSDEEALSSIDSVSKEKARSTGGLGNIESLKQQHSELLHRNDMFCQGIKAEDLENTSKALHFPRAIPVSTTEYGSELSDSETEYVRDPRSSGEIRMRLLQIREKMEINRRKTQRGIRQCYPCSKK